MPQPDQTQVQLLDQSRQPAGFQDHLLHDTVGMSGGSQPSSNSNNSEQQQEYRSSNSSSCTAAQQQHYCSSISNTTAAAAVIAQQQATDLPNQPHHSKTPPTRSHLRLQRHTQSTCPSLTLAATTQPSFGPLLADVRQASPVQLAVR